MEVAQTTNDKCSSYFILPSPPAPTAHQQAGQPLAAIHPRSPSPSPTTPRRRLSDSSSGSASGSTTSASDSAGTDGESPYLSDAEASAASTASVTSLLGLGHEEVRFDACSSSPVWR
jgi:hypothetical protein